MKTLPSYSSLVVMIGLSLALVLSLTACTSGSRSVYSTPDSHSQIMVTVAQNADPPTITVEPTLRSIEITVNTQTQSSQVTISIVPASMIPSDSAPVIFTSIGIDQRCGHGEVVAVDGHSLRATPEIPWGDDNSLETVPLGARVDIIDCRLWIDESDLGWLAVRTLEKKLGWMHIQSDKFYVTLYPIPLAPPNALTGIPADTMVAYVPPSECHPGPVSNEAVATSIGIDLIPVVGDFKGLGEAATGCDMVTGESLGEWRWFGLLGLIGLSEVALLRHGDEMADGVRIANTLDGSLQYSDEFIMSAARNADTVSDFLRTIDQFDDATDLGIDTTRLFGGGSVFSDEAIQALAKWEQPCSFRADTLVTTISGLIPISQIEPGDRVLAYDEPLETIGYYTVTTTFSHIDTVVTVLLVGTDTIFTTPEHPFFVTGRWIPAGQLQPGDLLYSVSEGSTSLLAAHTYVQPQAMFNIAVDRAHTFFVGEDSWLVHNACGKNLRNNMIRYGGDLPDWINNTSWQAHHIIPKEYADHPFVLRATKGGWNMDCACNGIALPVSDEAAAALNLPTHRGPHPAYSASVKRQLDTLEDISIRENWNDQRALLEINKLVESLRSELLN